MDATEPDREGSGGEVVDSSALHDTVLRHSTDACWVAVGDEVVVYDVAAPASHVLNPVAGLVWRCLDGSSSVGEILADVADVFEVPLEVAVGDFAPILDEWIDARIVTRGTR